MICTICGRDCEMPCEALNELRRIYDDERLKERRQLISHLRKLLNITDAESAPDLRVMAQKIIKKLPELHYIRDFDIKVGYVRSWERKTSNGKITYADCRKVNKVYGAYLPYDFIITFYERDAGSLSDNQRKILMWHELRHIGIGERGLTIEPHEIEDFFSITDEYSTRWNELGANIADILE